MPSYPSVQLSGLLAFNARLGHHLLIAPEERYCFIHIQEQDRRFIDMRITVRGHIQGRNLLVAEWIEEAV